MPFCFDWIQAHQEDKQIHLLTQLYKARMLLNRST